MTNPSSSLRGFEIQHIRKTLRISQPEFADGLGVTIRILSAFENDRLIPTPEQVAKIRQMSSEMYTGARPKRQSKKRNKQHKVFTDSRPQRRKFRYEPVRAECLCSDCGTVLTPGKDVASYYPNHRIYGRDCHGS